MVKHYPHTGTLSYVAAGTFNSIGIWTEGTLTTIGIVCNIQVSGRQLPVVSDDGVIIPYGWLIFCEPDTGFSSVPDAANLNFFDKDHVIKHLFEYQTHVEIKC